LIPPAWVIYGAIKALPQCWADRNDPRVDDYHERLSVAISEESNDEGDAAALITIAKHEGGLCIAPQERYTHSGAWSTFQLEGKNGKYPGPFIGLEYDHVHNAARAAADVWHHAGGCGHGVEGKFSVYAGGGRCGREWVGLRSRVNMYWYELALIRKADANG
jgi:hypothetical protein